MEQINNLVLGAGISGLSCAFHLNKKKQQTANQNNHMIPSREMVKGQKGKSKRRKAGILG